MCARPKVEMNWLMRERRRLSKIIVMNEWRTNHSTGPRHALQLSPMIDSGCSIMFTQIADSSATWRGKSAKLDVESDVRAAIVREATFVLLFASALFLSLRPSFVRFLQTHFGRGSVYCAQQPANSSLFRIFISPLPVRLLLLRQFQFFESQCYVFGGFLARPINQTDRMYVRGGQESPTES